MMDDLYSVENAQKFVWSSVTGNLHPERVTHLDTYLTGSKILDAGCGGGGYVEFLCRKGFAVTGIDKYGQFLQIAQQKRQMGHYIQGDITALPFSNKTFDCTYCFDVLEHINDQRGIQELARVTSKRLILAVPKEDDIMGKFGLTYYHYQDKTHLRNYTQASLRELISTVHHSKAVIFEELAVPMVYLFHEMVQFKDSPLKFFYQKAFNRLLTRLSYRQVHIGLVVVVDLCV